MNLYPALRAQMGSWPYYIVKMKMRELATEVTFARDYYKEDRTLDEATQRVLKEGRVRKEIVSYLARRPDRFFASIVVATMGGSPKFYPVTITDDDRFQVFVDQGLDEAFGVLTFSGEQKYYALDGQHRLSAIKVLMDRNDPDSQNAPEGFEDEEISVLMVVRQEEADAAFLQSYRRLFSSLNRYAKPTDQDTNIILDEDDAFAILTRRLITEHKFFQWAGRQRESQRVQTKGKNLKTTDPYFTSLQTLYTINETLLTAAWRRDTGWGSGREQELTRDSKIFTKFRPDEDYLDSLYDELVMYWDGLLEVIPDLRKTPSDMRVHDLEDGKEDKLSDNLLFWPIGQELLARMARRLLNKFLKDPRNPDQAGVVNSLGPLGKVEWALHQSPWRYFLLTNQAGTKWRMRSEDRTEALKIAERILAWVVGLDDLTTTEIDELKLDWQTRLVPAQAPEEQDQMWAAVQSMRAEIAR